MSKVKTSDHIVCDMPTVQEVNVWNAADDLNNAAFNMSEAEIRLRSAEHYLMFTIRNSFIADHGERIRDAIRMFRHEQTRGDHDRFKVIAPRLRKAITAAMLELLSREYNDKA